MKKKAVVSLLLTVALASQSPMYAMANSVNANPGDPVVTEQSVADSTDGLAVVSANGNGAVINITGDVEYSGNRGTAVAANSGGIVTVGGDVTSSGNNNTAVNIFGIGEINIAGSIITDKDNSEGINLWPNDVDEDMKVSVGGDVITKGKGSSAINASGSGALVTVEGDVITKGDWMLVQNQFDGKYFFDSSKGVQVSDGATVNINGSVHTSGTEANGVSIGDYNNSGKTGKVSVEGDIIVDGNGSTAIQAFGDNGNIYVGGDVVANGNNVEDTFPDGSPINPIAIGIHAQGNSVIKVDGNVSTKGATTIDASHGATILVGKDVLSEKDSAVCVYDNATVVVEGNVTGGMSEWDGKVFPANAISMDNSSTVIVENGVVTGISGDGTPIDINISSNTATGKLVVKKLVTKDSSTGIFITVNQPNPWEPNPYIPATVKELLDAIPDIIVGEAETDGEIIGSSYEWYLYVNGREDEIDELKEGLNQKVNYMVGVQSIENGSIEILEGTERNGDYTTAKSGTTLKVKIHANDGYEVSSVSGGKVNVTKNADGTYNLEVVNGGGIDISAVLKAVKKAEAVKEVINEIVNVEPPKEESKTFISNSVPGIEINDWQDVSTVLETKQDKIQAIPDSDVKMLQLVLPKNKVEIPKNVVASVNKSESAWLHCFVGNGNAVTFYNNGTLDNYIPTDFTLKETEAKDIKMIEFAKAQSIGTTVLFSTRVEAKNRPVTVWEWQNGQFVVLGVYTTTENGNVAFPIASTGRYAITY